MRRTRRAASVTCTVLALLCAGVLVVPLPAHDVFWAPCLVISEFSLWLVPAAVIAGALALTVRSWTRIVGVTAALLVALLAFLPWVRALPTADSTGAHLSLHDYLTSGINYATTPPDPSRTITYGNGLPMDVWLPVPRPPGPVPAVLWVHGGGFVAGRQSRTPQWDERLASLGYAVFDVQYRLTPPARWNEAVGDVKCAIGWVREHAADHGVDPARIMIVGESAGGELALLAAYTAGDDSTFAPSCATTDTSVRAVAGLYPIVDMNAGWHDDFLGGNGRDTLEQHLGGTPDQFPERYRQASPTTHVRPGVPPTLLVHGDRDTLVRADAHSRRLDAALSAAGADHELVVLPGAEHGFDLHWGGWSNQIARHVLEDFLHRAR